MQTDRSNIVLSNCACSRMFTSWKKWRNNAKKMELENANLKEAHMTIAEKMGKQNASWKETKITNGGNIARANATWKGAHLTNEEYMEGTNASWKEATSISFLWFLFVLHRVFDF